MSSPCWHGEIKAGILDCKAARGECGKINGSVHLKMCTVNVICQWHAKSMFCWALSCCRIAMRSDDLTKTVNSAWLQGLPELGWSASFFSAVLLSPSPQPTIASITQFINYPGLKADYKVFWAFPGNSVGFDLLQNPQIPLPLCCIWCGCFVNLYLFTGVLSFCSEHR